ncbi:Uncharacterised protein [Mycobacteroides abscessus subsp. abscessus]|nr:Uncharacterised protein [Mycobacteroides abscessus subsp. abscessus]
MADAPSLALSINPAEPTCAGIPVDTVCHWLPLRWNTSILALEPPAPLTAIT